MLQFDQLLRYEIGLIMSLIVSVVIVETRCVVFWKEAILDDIQIHICYRFVSWRNIPSPNIFINPDMPHASSILKTFF